MFQGSCLYLYIYIWSTHAHTREAEAATFFSVVYRTMLFAK